MLFTSFLPLIYELRSTTRLLSISPGISNFVLYMYQNNPSVPEAKLIFLQLGEASTSVLLVRIKF